MANWLNKFWPGTLLTMNEVLWVISQSGGGSTAVTGERYVGPDTTITLAHTPISGTVKMYRGGARQDPATDYSIAGAVVTPTNPIVANEVVLFDYNY